MTTKFKLGPITIDAQAYGSQGNAVLGIRDSGKSYTATELAEKLFDAGVPFVTFDPTGIWRFLRVPGKGHGYPIVVAGGKSADLPLTVTGAVEIVRAAMKNGVSVVLDLTDPSMSKANWRAIVKSCVRVLLQENAEHGLRHIFFEEAAEFVPQRVLDGDVYAEVEKLARIGGNSRLGYTLINQRSQEVNKAVLELCENLFLHRQKGKNAIQSLDHWLGIAGVDQAEIVKSLPSLPSGTCWAWMGDRAAPTLVQVPPKNSFHPDRRTMHGATGKRSRKAVDVGTFVQGMKAALTEIIEKEAANDPKALRAEIAKLKADLARVPAATLDKTDLQIAEQRGYDRARRELVAAAAQEVMTRVKNVVTTLRAAGDAFAAAIDDAAKEWKVKPDLKSALTYTPEPLQGSPARAPARVPVPAEQAAMRRPAAPRPVAEASGDGSISGPEQRILNSLASWRWLGHQTPTNAQVAWLARYSPTSSSYTNPRGALNSKGLITYPGPDCVAATDEGLALALETRFDGASIQGYVLQQLPGPERRILEAVIRRYPDASSNEEIAGDANYSASSSSYTNPRGSLRSKELITYPSNGLVKAADWLFAEAA